MKRAKLRGCRGFSHDAFGVARFFNVTTSTRRAQFYAIRAAAEYEQRLLLQGDVAVQHLVGTADVVERAAFVSPVVQAMRHASAAFRAAVRGERKR